MIPFKKFLNADEKRFSLDTPGLNILRKDMPQVSDANMPEYFVYLKSKGAKIVNKKMSAKTLKHTQKNFNTAGVKRMLQGFKKVGLKKPVIVSQDNFIIDGHHRWLAAKHLDKDVNAVHITNMKVRELLKITKAFPKVEFRTGK
ncbi:MAG: hypothetical protein COA84_13425 [Robiginitomaculum sp.]|nr:MAG: hypothetical protein COA84_13425 [Robiginitomaculum sp.]